MSAGIREERSRKRRKVDATAPPNPPAITSSDQLHQLLHSAPSASSNEVKAAVDQFKEFLSEISLNEKSPDQSRQLKILKEYCDRQSSSSHDQVDFPDLLSTWSSASQSNAEPILSAVPAALAQFFCTISSHLEFREFGLSLCHGLLKRDQLRIFDRSLSSPRAKEHLLTPCLQLLTELASFDGGALASNVFNRRDFLYRRLDGILNQTPSNPTKSQDGTAQKAALDFLLANLKYLDAAPKSELITHGKLIYSAIRSLPNVDADTVSNVLGSLERSVLSDDSLSKQMKVRCFNSGVLSALAKLYDYRVGEDMDPSPDVRDALQRLLLQVCTSAKGVLLSQAGWYPPGTLPEILEQDENMIDLGLDSPFHHDDYTEKVPVKNTTLSTFSQTLRPENDVLQASLITGIFKAAPELIADYFTKKPKFLVPPGDDPKWRGQFAFLFSVVQLPVPENCGWHEKLPLTPPPLSILIQSIFPRPLDRATIGKCLRMNEDIMTISAVRLLTVAFGKLDAVLKTFDKAPTETTLWRQASTKLTTLFVDRIPPFHDIVTALQKVDQDNEQTRTAVLECISTYLAVLPSFAASSKFDFGPSLSKALQMLESEGIDAETKDTVPEQIQQLVQIADISPATKWFHKSASDEVSLVVQLVKSCVQDPGRPVMKRALPVLKSILTGKGLFSTNTKSLEALISSLSTTKKWQPEIATYQFLDNCLSRTMQRPVKYLDQLEQAQQLLSDSTDLSLVACCVAEQWQYAIKKEEKKDIKNVAEWVAKFFSALDAAGENYRVMNHFKEEMVKQCDHNEKAKTALEKAFEKQRKKPAILPELRLDDTEPWDNEIQHEDVSGLTQRQESILTLTNVFHSLPSIPNSLAGLNRWANPDFESEIQTGRLASLIRCLISPESEIRLQAFHTLQSVVHAVQQSTYDEQTQLYLLLGELCETVKPHNLSTSAAPPPSIVAELAIHFLPIISEPSSPFYRKTNNFLLRAPSWSVPHILTYWINETFLIEPEIDDADFPFHVPHGVAGGNVNAQALEIDHFVDLLLRSLRTEEDMNLFRRAQVFTRLFSYYLAPICTKSIRRKILGVVYRATQVRGGSDTLITRTGVREWLSIAKTVRGHSGHGVGFGKVDGESKGWVEAVEREVERTCDNEGIQKWEGERRIFREANGDGDPGASKDKTTGRKERMANGVGVDGEEGHSESDSDSDSDSDEEAKGADADADMETK